MYMEELEDDEGNVYNRKTYEDLKKRFSTFGNVSALDGFGKLDALGQPRPYAYITLETTKGQLSRCK